MGHASAVSLVHVNIPAQNGTGHSTAPYEPDDRFLLRGKVLKVATLNVRRILL